MPNIPTTDKHLMIIISPLSQKAFRAKKRQSDIAEQLGQLAKRTILRARPGSSLHETKAITASVYYAHIISPLSHFQL